MDALAHIPDELTETDEGHVPVADTPVLATPTVITSTVTTSTLL